jgi:8-oxo-dGTP diphosphatase
VTGMAPDDLLSDLTGQAAQDGVEKLVVGAVIERDAHVLLLHRPRQDFMGGIYELPSGTVEPGEALDVALVREVEEETGLDVDAIGAYLGAFDYTSASGRRTRQFTFAVAVHTTGPIILTEHDEYCWSELGGQLPVTDAVRDLLAGYLDGGLPPA